MPGVNGNGPSMPSTLSPSTSSASVRSSPPVTSFTLAAPEARDRGARVAREVHADPARLEHELDMIAAGHPELAPVRRRHAVERHVVVCEQNPGT